MPHVSGEIVIARPVDVVFDVVADERNEPRYNPAMRHAEKLTDGPVGAGTRFHAVHAARGQPMEMTVELTEYEPPRRVGSTTTTSWATIRGAVTFEPLDGATRMRWDWDVHPKGFAKLLTPVVGLVGRRQERACWTGLKRYLESDRREKRP